MDCLSVFEFLEALNANNSKEWMDANRSWYEEAKGTLAQTFEPILTSLKELDPRIVQPTARKCISRINNNLMFHPDRPTYKDHFGIVVGYGKGLSDFYLHFGLHETYMAGGLWHPSSEPLKKVRNEIDYEGHKLKNIVESPAFQDCFGGLWQEDKLKTTPKGFDKDSPFIDLLRLKSFAAIRPVSRKNICSVHLQDLVLETYSAIVPMLDFINIALVDN